MHTKFKDKVKVTLYLPLWMHRQLKKQWPNQSQFIERLLIDSHGWEPKKRNKEG